MELVKDILVKLLEKDDASITFSNITVNIQELIEVKCFNALEKIKAIIGDDNLNDFECIEKIICVLNEAGISSGNRHDFG